MTMFTRPEECRVSDLGVHHNKFELDLARLGRVMKIQYCDTRNFFSRADAEDAGFDYHLLGASQRF